MTNFVTLNVATFSQKEGTTDLKEDSFEMYVRPDMIAAFNAVTEAPSPSVKSIVFYRDAGIKPTLCKQTCAEINELLN